MTMMLRTLFSRSGVCCLICFYNEVSPVALLASLSTFLLPASGAASKRRRRLCRTVASSHEKPMEADRSMDPLRCPSNVEERGPSVGEVYHCIHTVR